MDYRLDDIDRRILYHLAGNARDTSAPDVAEEVNVSAGTIRNRIRQLEEHGVVRGYHAHVDYERADGLLTNLYVCDAPVSERDATARKILQVPGVVNVRDVMTGAGGLHVKAVGRDTDDLSRIARQIEGFGADIIEEDLIQREYFRPYEPFGPEDAHRNEPMTNFLSLAGEAEVVDVTVTDGAPIAGRTLAAANAAGLLDEDVLVVAIEREDAVITPKGETAIEPGDVVTVFTPEGLTPDLMDIFAEADEETA